MDKPGDDNQYSNIQQANRIAFLVAGFIKQRLTTEEEEELDDWITASEDNERLFGELTDEKNIAASLAAHEKINTEAALREVHGKIRKYGRSSSRRYLRYAIAACIIALAGLTVFLVKTTGKRSHEVEIVSHDIAPGSGRAALTLGDGKVILLRGEEDTIINSTIRVTAATGQISYAAGEQAPGQYHVLTVPRKGHFSLVLPDGTKVWLNSESSVRFPLAFSDNERLVEVTGETYFVVAKNKLKPFRVTVNGMTVEATGTEFNINAYADEPAMTTTLVEGSVKVKFEKDSVALQPGEESVLKSLKFTKNKTETTTATAWKDNIFKFRKAGPGAIMRQLARWYDVHAEFREPVPVHLNATIGRDVPLSKVLELLEGTGEIKFKLEENKVIVSK